MSGPAPLGAQWQCSRIWGNVAGSDRWVDQVSPLNGTLIQRVPLLDPAETAQMLDAQHVYKGLDTGSLSLFCSRLHDELHALRPAILETTQLETAFNRRDCAEIVDSCLEYVRGFPDYHTSLSPPSSTDLSYSADSQTRRVRQIDVPWGTIAAILPQSAFLYLALSCFLNALVTGNRVILRAPTQSARSAGLLGLAVHRAQPPAGSVSIVMISARVFVEAICKSTRPILVHYLGSSARAPDLLSGCFVAGKQVIIDGEGNTWMWIDEDVAVERACDILTSGALRYNGQTCTSINGAIIHPKLHASLKERLAARWNGISAGNPLEADVEIGPLLDESQAEHCLALVMESGGAVLAGGRRDGSLLMPTLVSEPPQDSALVCKGVFGPVMWIAPGTFGDFQALWPRNRYPLCAGILSSSNAREQRMLSLPNLARLVINGDPSEEYMYEPWGGYPAAGNNTVSQWHRKYLRPVQVDSPTSPAAS